MQGMKPVRRIVPTRESSGCVTQIAVFYGHEPVSRDGFGVHNVQRANMLQDLLLVTAVQLDKLGDQLLHQGQVLVRHSSDQSSPVKDIHFAHIESVSNGSASRDARLAASVQDLAQQPTIYPGLAHQINLSPSSNVQFVL